MNQYKESSRIKGEKILALLEQPMTVVQLAEKICMSVRGTNYWIRRLRSEFYITRYLPGSAHAPVFHRGSKPDAVLTRQTSQQYNTRFHAKLKKDFDRYDRKLLMDRTRHYKPRRDPMTAALFGAPIHSQPKETPCQS